MSIKNHEAEILKINAKKDGNFRNFSQFHLTHFPLCPLHYKLHAIYYISHGKFDARFTERNHSGDEKW